MNILLLAGNSQLISNIFLIGMILVVFYFFILRPQTKKANEQRTFIDSLEKGDKVITTGGIHGKVVKVEDQTVLISVDNKSFLTVEKVTISTEMTLAMRERPTK